MFGWLFKTPPPPKETLRLRVAEGKKGRWRWSLIDSNDKTVGVAPIRGWGTREEAIESARRIRDAKII